MLKDYFEVPNKPAIKSGNVLSCDFTDHETFIPQPLDFTRNTLATYVDCNGFIKVSGVSNTELVTNGDFSNGSTDWTINPAWSIANGKAFYDETINSQRLKQDIATDASKTYQIKFTISGVESGKFARFALWVISNATSKFFNYTRFKDGDYVIYASPDGANGNVLHFNALNAASSDSSFYITNISLKEVDLNVPRIDYLTEIGKAKELQKPSLLLEPQSTNLITFSEDFSQWDSIGSTQTSVENTNPINATAYKIESTVNTSSRIFISGIMTSTNTYSSSYLVKATSNSPQYLGFACISNTIPDVLYNFANDQFEDNTISGNAAKCESISIANDWKLLKVPVHSSVNNTRLNIYQGSKSGNQLVGTIGQSYFIKLAQLEELNYCTSYIPTFGSTVTRNGEVCNNAGQLGVFPTIAEPDGTFYGEFKGLTDVYGQYSLISINDGSSDNLVGFGFNNVGNKLWIRCKKRNAQIISDLSQTYDVDKFQKVAIKFSTGSNSIYLNGNQTISNQDNRIFDNNINQFDLNFQSNQYYFYGRVREIKSFRRALTDTELTELTNNIT